MANTITHKKSAVPSKVPLAINLTLGELAINTADGKLFTKKSDGSVVQIGAGGAGGAAATADALSTPRLINGVAFDGTSNITITAAASIGANFRQIESAGKCHLQQYTGGSWVDIQLSDKDGTQYAVTSTSTSTALISPVQNVLTVAPAADSQGLFFGLMGQTVMTGSSSVTGGGHILGSMGWGVHAGSGTIARGIGVEGRYDHLSNAQSPTPISTEAVGTLGLVNNPYGNIVESKGVASETAVLSPGTITTAYGHYAEVLPSTGTISKYVGFAMPQMQGVIAGITTKRFFENLDTAAPAITKSPIVQQDFGYSSPTSGSTVQIPDNMSDFTVVPGRTLAALTVAFPVNVIDGQTQTFTSLSNITALTLTTVNGTISAPVTTLTGGGSITYKWIGTPVNMWIPKTTDVRGASLIGLSTASGTPITSSSTVIDALGSLQNQVSNAVAATATSSGIQPVARIPTTQRIVAGAIGATALSTIAAVASRIQFIPYVPARQIMIASIGFSVSTLTAGTATVGIYANDGNASYDYPGTRLAACTAGAINTGTTGTKTAAVPYVLEAGVLYFIAVICTAACTLRGVALAGQDCMLGWTDNNTTNISSYYNAGSTNVLPTTAAAPTVNAGIVIPALYLIEG